MADYSIVLSDELLKEFYEFKHNGSFNVNTVAKLLNLYKPPHITNVAQLLRCNIEDRPLMQQLVTKNWKNVSLDELVNQTKFKLIISDENNCTFPKIDISSKSIESNYTSTHFKTDNRDNVIKHIELLCKNATNIFIYDKYFKNNWDRTKKLFQNIMPKKRLIFFYKEYHLDQAQISEAKIICSDWIFRLDQSHPQHENLHDRYLIIDNKIEIILTSGFDNLFDTSTDLTYIIRDI